MILTCPDCDTSFNFDDRLVKPSGSKVRCSKCHSVFTAYSEGESAPAPAAAASSAAAGLDDLDLDALTADLDLDIDTADQEQSGAATDDELDFDLGLEDQVAETPSGGDTQYQETQELDLSDFDLDGASGTTDTPAADAADDDLSFDLDLDQEDDASDAESEITSADTETKDISDLEFDLGLDLETDGETDAAAEDTGAAADDDLDFSLDLDMDEEPAAADAAPAGGDPDSDLMDETRAMDLGELDDLLSSAQEPGEKADSAGQADDLDIDFDMESDATGDAVEEDSTEELEFDLGLDEDDVPAAAQEAAPAMEETEELDLADLEEMIETDDDAEAAAEESSDDFELDLDMVETDASGDMPMEETEELDLTGLEDELEPEASSGSAAGEAADDMDLELDFDADGEEPAVADDLDEDDEGDFDLTDLDDMLEMDEEEGQEPAAAAGGDDFDLELEIDDNGIPQDFEVDDDEESAAVDAAAMAEAPEDSFDMGSVAGLDETGDGDSYFDDDEMEYADEKPAKKSGPALSRPFKILLVLVLLVGGGYGAVTLLKFFGIEVPFVDTVKEMDIPYVSDLLGPKDPGYLNIAILEKQLKGNFVNSNKLGNLYVVRGKVKNNYKHARSYINLTGKLYTKGGQLKQTKTVYAGSTLSDERLAGINQAQLIRRENNRNGSKRSNVNVPRGKVLPFMIVFTNLPPNLDEYSVEVASSEKAR